MNSHGLCVIMSVDDVKILQGLHRVKNQCEENIFSADGGYAETCHIIIYCCLVCFIHRKEIRRNKACMKYDYWGFH